MKYSLGLDIGTTSVGWAVLNEDLKRIEDLGVRIFEAPENPKNGESLAKPRRDARSARRRNKRRRQRLDYLKQFFIQKSLLDAEQIQELLQANHQYDPYEIRNRALNEKLSNEELFLAIYHIAKRRGYKSNRKKVEENDKESGRVLTAIKKNRTYLESNKTIGSALFVEANFAAHKRNKADSYSNSFIREDFLAEAFAILQAQGWSEQDINELFYDPQGQWGGIFDQRPFMTKELIEKMRGFCPLEKTEPRAQKASWSFELFRLAQDLAHLEYNNGNKLTSEQIANVIETCKKTQKVSYKRVRDSIGFKNNADFKFDYIRGKSADSYEESEKNTFCELKFYHAIRKALGNDFAVVEANIDAFDEIGLVLTANKSDKDVEDALTKWQNDFAINLSQESLDNLMKLSFSSFAHLSITALRKLTPALLQGNTYDKAIEIVYPGRFSEKLSGDKNELPPLSEQEQNQITNPVVKRAIGQTRRVVNAVIKKYGAPYQIKIECTNELSKTFDERRKIKKLQDENQAQNERRVEKLKELGIVTPTGSQIFKYRLREEQCCKCLYCGKPLTTDIFFDDKLAEIDHIIPFSRCGNDGNNNKALVCAECNQEKKEKTPFEKWGTNTERWQIINDLAKTQKWQKRDRILAEKLPKEEWNKRALNDTRYVMKFMSQYIKRNLKFSDESKGKQKVLLPTGFITSYLRKMYHLGQKDRELNNCHHAVDACVIASVSQAQIQKFATWNKYKELGARYHAVQVRDEQSGEIKFITKADYENITSLLLPWPEFDKEVKLRTGMMHDAGEVENFSDFRDKFRAFDNYDEEFLSKLQPLFVSRLPKRGAGGAAHKETLRSPKADSEGRRLQRMRLVDATRKDIENSILSESDKSLYDQLIKLIDEKGEKEAFKKPVYKNGKKFDKNGRPLSPVSTIKVYSTQPSGILINNGTQFVNNGSTICLNIYKRKMNDGSVKYFAAPRYVNKIHAKELEILPAPNGRSAEEKAEFSSLRVQSGVNKGKIFASESNGFKYVDSLYPNDYVQFKYSDGHTIEGYYVCYDVSVGTISLIDHNSSSKDKESKKRPTLGKVISLRKLNISVLGDNYRHME